MIVNEKINIKVNPNSRVYYNSIGYKCSNYETIEIKTVDLPAGSNIEILVRCDVCLIERLVKYNRYLKNTKNNTILYTCKKCSFIKNKKTKLERYGSENYQNTEKIKKTKLERYGSENYTNRIKAKKTCIEKYGVDNVSKSDHIKSIKMKTNIDNWGVDNVFKSEEIKNKISKSVRIKYGSDNYVTSDDCKNKYKMFGI